MSKYEHADKKSDKKSTENKRNFSEFDQIQKEKKLEDKKKV